MIEPANAKQVIRTVLVISMARNGLTEDQLAAEAKISPLTVRHILDSEDTSFPTIKTLIKVCNALDLPLSTFFKVKVRQATEREIILVKGE
ncbi:MAG: helix-turn-helix transcriptional regulator [Alphaproteobacteria bacterium]|nr:helix-turn-helix transcriptional regulator [Alphaproteobacteria bacterium]